RTATLRNGHPTRRRPHQPHREGSATALAPPTTRPAPCGWAPTRTTRSPTTLAVSTTSPTFTPPGLACSPPLAHPTRCSPAWPWPAAPATQFSLTPPPPPTPRSPHPSTTPP